MKGKHRRIVSRESRERKQRWKSRKRVRTKGRNARKRLTQVSGNGKHEEMVCRECVRKKRAKRKGNQKEMRERGSIMK